MNDDPHKDFKAQVKRMQDLYNYNYKSETYPDPGIIDPNKSKKGTELIDKNKDKKEGELFPKEAQHSNDILQRKEEVPSKDPRLLNDDKH